MKKPSYPFTCKVIDRRYPQKKRKSNIETKNDPFITIGSGAQLLPPRLSSETVGTESFVRQLGVPLAVLKWGEREKCELCLPFKQTCWNLKIYEIVVKKWRSW